MFKGPLFYFGLGIVSVLKEQKYKEKIFLTRNIFRLINSFGLKDLTVLYCIIIYIIIY